MFGSTIRRLAVSPYAIFLKEAYKNTALAAKLQDLERPQKARLLARVYKNLSKKEKEAFYKTARQTTFPRRVRVKAPLKKFAVFVKNHYHTNPAVQSLTNTQERMKKLGELYRQQTQ